MAFVILFLSPFLSFSGTVHVPVNQALSRDKEMKKPLPLAPHFSAIIPCKHRAAEDAAWIAEPLRRTEVMRAIVALVRISS